MQNFQHLFKNNVEYPRETKKNLCVISRGLERCSFSKSFFCLEVSEGCNINNFTKFPEVELCFTWNFQGNREKWKQVQRFFKKRVCLNPPPPACLVFSSGIAHSETIDSNWSYEAFAQKEYAIYIPGICFCFLFDVSSVALHLINTVSVKVVQILDKFYWYGICSSPVQNFNCFCIAKTVILCCFLGGFLARTLQIQPTFLTSNDTQDDASDMLQFFEVLRNGLNWAKKLIFGSFWSFFCLRPCTPYEIRRKILQNEIPY